LLVRSQEQCFEACQVFSQADLEIAVCHQPELFKQAEGSRVGGVVLLNSLEGCHDQPSTLQFIIREKLLKLR
jgi:hypothetical protein